MSLPSLSHEELRGLLGVYAVGAISAEERTLVEAHLDGCRECLVEVADHHEALGTLTRDEPIAVRTASWEAVRGGIVLAASPLVPTRAASTARRTLPRLAGVVAIAACSVAVTLVVTRERAGSPQMTAPIVAAKPSTPLAGSVKLFDPESDGGHVVLDLRNVPDVPAGHHYEVWVRRSGDTAEMEAIGAFMPDKGRASLSLNLPGPGEYVSLDISIQEDAGPQEHSGSSVGGATLTS